MLALALYARNSREVFVYVVKFATIEAVREIIVEESRFSYAIIEHAFQLFLFSNSAWKILE